MIIISPYSKPLINGNRNAKNYPYWEELIRLIQDHLEYFGEEYPIVQIGADKEERIKGTTHFACNPPFSVLKNKLDKCECVISVDNFLQHFSHYYKFKIVVLWGQSNPDLFGYKENMNILKDRKYLRNDQFNTWEAVPYIEEAFLSADEVFDQIKHLL